MFRRGTFKKLKNNCYIAKLLLLLINILRLITIVVWASETKCVKLSLSFAIWKGVRHFTKRMHQGEPTFRQRRIESRGTDCKEFACLTSVDSYLPINERSKIGRFHLQNVLPAGRQVWASLQKDANWFWTYPDKSGSRYNRGQNDKGIYEKHN